MITIHGGSVSPFVRKTRVFCTEKGIPFETTDLSPIPKTPELLAMNPLGKIPILEAEDGSYIPDSSVICAYLERIQPSPPLYPEDPKQYAQVLFFEEWADTKGVEATSPVLFERVIKPLYFKQQPDDERLAKTREELAGPILDAFEARLSGDPYLVGGRFTLADCALGAQLQSWALGGEEIDAARWPKLRAYADAILSRGSFKALSEAIAAA